MFASTASVHSWVFTSSPKGNLVTLKQSCPLHPPQPLASTDLSASPWIYLLMDISHARNHAICDFLHLYLLLLSTVSSRFINVTATVPIPPFMSRVTPSLNAQPSLGPFIPRWVFGLFPSSDRCERLWYDCCLQHLSDACFFGLCCHVAMLCLTFGWTVRPVSGPRGCKVESISPYPRFSIFCLFVCVLLDLIIRILVNMMQHFIVVLVSIYLMLYMWSIFFMCLLAIYMAFLVKCRFGFFARF